MPSASTDEGKHRKLKFHRGSVRHSVALHLARPPSIARITSTTSIMVHVSRGTSSNLHASTYLHFYSLRKLRPGRARSSHVRSSFLLNLSNGADVAKHEALAGTPVLRVSDAVQVCLTEEWEDDLCVLVFARSFGCPFCQEMARQLARDVLPELQKLECKLLLVSIGTAETGVKFSELTGFPADILYADADNALYDALQFNQGPLVTYISPITPIAIGTRALRTGLQDLKDTLKTWVPWQAPKGVRQASIQGGTLVFDGRECVWSHYDKATADHADFDAVINAVRAQKLGK